MNRRQPLPRLWLMTDERQGEGLWAALESLPRGAGIVFRHYGLPDAERRRLFERVRRIAARRRLMLLAAGSQRLRADGRHGGRGSRNGLASAAAHDLRELKAAERGGAHLVFLSPAFPTRSHPGARALGRIRFGAIARQARIPVIALGGMNARRGRGLAALGAYGWAAIDAFAPDQKRKAVPI
jgi:thiamine-phosphate pyrophosphorylase